MNEFDRSHPIVSFTYFFVVTLFSMLLMNPVYLAISFVCGFSYSLILGGKKHLKFNFVYLIPTLIITAVLNPLFNHEGITVIDYFPSGNPLTLESVYYGVAAAVMLITVISWFSCFNKIFTSDKLIYMFGKIIPSLSLVFSMILRFIPVFGKRAREISDARKCLGIDDENKIKKASVILSTLTSMSLESSVEIADSMKSRGYGLAGRTSFSIFKFNIYDFVAICLTVISGLYVLFGKISGETSFTYFPSVKYHDVTAYGVSVAAVYFLLCATPVFIEIIGRIKWKFIKSKI